jgi:hypothetical protein
VDGKFQKATFFDEANVEAKALRTSVRKAALPAWDGHGESGTLVCGHSMNIMESHGF